MCVPGQPPAPGAVPPAAAEPSLAAAPTATPSPAATPSPTAVPSPTAAATAAAAALSCLARTDTGALTAAEQAECLRALARAESALVAARSAVLTPFTARRGFEADGHGGTRSWLKWRTRVTGAAAAGAVGWMRRLAAHPAVRDALTAGKVSVSWARAVCDWTDLLPASARGDADVILLGAAAGGAELADLAGLAEELRRRTAVPDSDGDDDGFEDRSLRLGVHYRGAAKLDGDLTPQCAAALRAVLDALGKRAGPEDTRSQVQRDHDALEEACRRLIAAGCMPGRAGQPTQIQLHMTLADLLGLSGAAAAGAGPAAGPGHDCDASIAPVVSGHVDPEVLDRLARAGTRELTLRDAIALLSGPAGLAARLRTGLLAGPAGSISLPLDVGAATGTIPPHLRRAVIARDRHCAFPGGCDVPASACQVHHTVPRSEGGPTSLGHLMLGCSFHHLIAIHRWGWNVTINADGTKTAISPDGNRVIHSHSPPA